jgi:hypothetical protein
MIGAKSLITSSRRRDRGWGDVDSEVTNDVAVDIGVAVVCVPEAGVGAIAAGRRLTIIDMPDLLF